MEMALTHYTNVDKDGKGCRGNGGSNLFESVPNHNHNWPSMLHLHLSPTFSQTLFFVCVKETLQLLGEMFSQLGWCFLFFFRKIPPLFSAIANDYWW